MIYIEQMHLMPLTTHCSSIYFLMLDEVVVYVGQSVNYVARIGQHKAEGVKNFNGFKVCELPHGVDVNFVEFCEIADRKPIYNSNLPCLDFLLTAADINKLDDRSQGEFDIDSPDYKILMPSRIFCYWKMGGFTSYYTQLDMCRGLELKGIEG